MGIRVRGDERVRIADGSAKINKSASVTFLAVRADDSSDCRVDFFGHLFGGGDVIFIV